jgi:hypothetical protein
MSSDFVVEVLQERMDQSRRAIEERRDWLAQGRGEYTERVCEQTLELNEEFPIHDE